MPRIQPVEEAAADPRSADLLAGVRRKLGIVPNLMATLAHAPVALKSYLNLSQTLAGGTLSPRLREQLALVVGEANGCGYCVAAHTALGAQAGVDASQALEARRAASDDPVEDAALKFAAAVVAHRGAVTDAHFAAARAAGLSDEQISEVVAHVALNTFTNYFNLVAGTQVDFPAAPELAA